MRPPTPPHHVLAALGLACAGLALGACGGSGGDVVAASMAGRTATVAALAPAAPAATTPFRATPAPLREVPAPAPDRSAAAGGADSAPDQSAPVGGADSAPDRSAPQDATDPAPGQSAPGDGADPAGASPSAPAAAPAPARRVAQPTIHLKRATPLRSRPNGPVIATLGPKTSFGSPTVLAVVRQSGPWLGVLAPETGNGRIGWISARAPYTVYRTDWRVDASLRRREVVVRRGGRIVTRFPVAVGGPGSPTPTGRFAVTDKLLTGNPSSPYGCCILALSGRQTKTLQGWGGGDRIAIHATNLPETIGTEASLGCLRAPTEAIRRVVDTVPLGTIVTIRA